MRSNPARNACFACGSPEAYTWIRTSVPMCGSTASNRWSSPARAGHAISASAALLVQLHTVVPVAVHLFRRGDLRRTHQPESEPLRVRVIPDALGKLRVLHLPIGARRGSRR